jgi:hypothetical protein
VEAEASKVVEKFVCAERLSGCGTDWLISSGDIWLLCGRRKSLKVQLGKMCEFLLKSSLTQLEHVWSQPAAVVVAIAFVVVHQRMCYYASWVVGEPTWRREWSWSPAQRSSSDSQAIAAGLGPACPRLSYKYRYEYIF